MQLVDRDVEMIAYYRKDGTIEPIRFRFMENDEFQVVPIKKVIDRKKEKIYGEPTIIFYCSAIVNNMQKILELRFRIRQCSWILYKIR